MPITYQNFRGDTYYLHSRLTKKGNTTYHFSKKSDGILVEYIPEGFEIYEDPNGKVYLRKASEKLITDEELEVIENGMRKYSSVQDFKLDVKKEFVSIYACSNPGLVGEFNGLFQNLDQLDKYKHYETEMRFCLIDKETRTFEVQRFCFLGSIDDWIELDASENLEELVKEYVRHLGEESLYELF